MLRVQAGHARNPYDGGTGAKARIGLRRFYNAQPKAVRMPVSLRNIHPFLRRRRNAVVKVSGISPTVKCTVWVGAVKPHTHDLCN